MTLYCGQVLPAGFLGDDIERMVLKQVAYNPPTQTPQKGIILLSYFTKSGPDVPVDSSVNCTRLNTTPYT